MIQPVGDDPKRQSFSPCNGFLASSGVRHHPRQLRNFGKPAAVLFSLGLDSHLNAFASRHILAFLPSPINQAVSAWRVPPPLTDRQNGILPTFVAGLLSVSVLTGGTRRAQTPSSADQLRRSAMHSVSTGSPAGERMFCSARGTMPRTGLRGALSFHAARPLSILFVGRATYVRVQDGRELRSLAKDHLFVHDRNQWIICMQGISIDNVPPQNHSKSRPILPIDLSLS